MPVYEIKGVNDKGKIKHEKQVACSDDEARQIIDDLIDSEFSKYQYIEVYQVTILRHIDRST